MLLNIGICLVAALVFMSVVFLTARRLGRFDIVDAAWGLVFIVIALTSFLLQSGQWWDVDAPLIVTTLVIIWGVRLSWHITQRLKHSSGEDWRYQQLRKKWGKQQNIQAFFRIFMTQGLLALVVCAPVMVINLLGNQELSVWTLVGSLVWLFGFMFESVGDKQLKDFLANPKNKGKIMDRGLWQYSRHPNYFGEVVQWWGIFIIALALPYGWASIIGPALITYVILFVTGIPLTEKHFDGRPGWDKYKRKTSVFIPLPPSR